jgi:hypothetical protein
MNSPVSPAFALRRCPRRSCWRSRNVRTIGVIAGSIIAAIITTQVPRKKPRAPGLVPGPASIPAILRSVATHAAAASVSNAPARAVCPPTRPSARPRSVTTAVADGAAAGGCRSILSAIPQLGKGPLRSAPFRGHVEHAPDRPDGVDVRRLAATASVRRRRSISASSSSSRARRYSSFSPGNRTVCSGSVIPFVSSCGEQLGERSELVRPSAGGAPDGALIGLTGVSQRQAGSLAVCLQLDDQACRRGIVGAVPRPNHAVGGGESSSTSHSTWPRQSARGSSRRVKRVPTFASKPSALISQRSIIRGSVRACQTRSIGTGNSSSIEISSLMAAHRGDCLRVQPVPPELAVSTRPVIDLSKCRWTKPIDATPPGRLATHKPGASQDRKMLRGR